MTAVPVYHDGFDLIADLDRMPDVDSILTRMQEVLSRYGVTKLLVSGLAEAQFERREL